MDAGKKFITLIAAALCGIAIIQDLGAAQNQSALSPNFIIILTDDQGYGDIGCYGSTTIRTPNIDKMAQEGIRFTDFYDCASVCSPTRASLMTGCYPKRVSINGVIHVADSFALHLNEITLAEILRSKAGYKTGCFGKWHLGNDKSFLPPNQGFDYWYGLPYSNDMTPLPLYRNLTVIGTETAATQKTLTKRYTQEAVKFITDNAANPFFVYLAHSMPHIPLAVSADFAGTSSQGLYGDACQELDWSTGQILQTLKNLRLDSNTLVVYLSDNGPWLAQGQNAGTTPFRGGKFDTWEGGFRAPCVMRWPGTVPAGVVCPEIGAIMDFYVTFCAIAGIPLPGDRVIDGKNLYPVLTQTPGAATPHETFLYCRQPNGVCDAIRSGKWKYCITTGALYDLSKDPRESTNLAGANAAVVASLRTKLLELDGEITRNARPAGHTGDVAVNHLHGQRFYGATRHASPATVDLQGRVAGKKNNAAGRAIGPRCYLPRKHKNQL
jgi:arylsulfatase A-like enzyme